MAKSTKLRGDSTVVWTAPEQRRGEVLKAALESGASAEEIAELAARPVTGQYHEHLGDEVVEGRVTAKLGDLLVWVHPHGQDSGWYEPYTGEPADYQPVITEERS
jgi:hypothetical protein